MPELQPFTHHTTNLIEYIGRPMQTAGCIIMFCEKGHAIVECNFKPMALREGEVALIFFGSLFSITKISPGFSVRLFELSQAFTDEITISTADAFFDWIYDHPIISVPNDKRIAISLWLRMIDWTEANTDDKYRSLILRNQWQNFFLGLESELRYRLTGNDIKSISSIRRLFNGFCKLISENCRAHHEVKFYAERLCITPYYLSIVTQKAFGVSPKELIDRQIIMEIKALLTTTEMTIKEIAARYHFETSSYFCRYFRRHTGQTPKEYRNMQYSQDN